MYYCSGPGRATAQLDQSMLLLAGTAQKHERSKRQNGRDTNWLEEMFRRVEKDGLCYR